MSALSIQPTYPIFTDIDGQPLEDGYIWIGVVNLAPIVNPITVYWDAALTIPAAQPIRTRGGYPVNSGTPARLYVNSDYSIQVQNKNGSVVYSAPAATERFGNLIDSSSINYLAPGAGAVLRTVKSRLDDFITVFDYMTPAQIADVQSGSPVLDVSAAVQAAVDANKQVYFPPGRYVLNTAVTLQDNQQLIGAGPSPWDPYNTPPQAFAPGYMTEIIVSNNTAFDMTGVNNTEVNGFSFKSSLGQTSFYGSPGNYAAGAIGIDGTQMRSCRIRNVSFFGLEYGLAVNPSGTANGGGQWTIEYWLAWDCKSCIRVGAPGGTPYSSADIQINNCIIADHSNKLIEVHDCDGVRIEDCRLFKCYENNIYLRACPFVTLSGVTCFESGNDNMEIIACQYVTGAAIHLVRAGGYTTTTPWQNRSGIYIEDSYNVALQGVIERPGGRAVHMVNCYAVTLNLSILQPYYTSAMLSPIGTDGAIDIYSSSEVNLNCSLNMVSGNNIYSVTSNFASYDKIFGVVTSNGFANVGLPIFVSPETYSYKYTLPSDTLVNTLSSFPIAKKRVWVPAGKKLVTRMVHMTSPDTTLRVGALFWVTNLILEADGGYTSFEKKTIFDNSAGPDQFYVIAFEIFNDTGGAITVPAGHQVFVSMALE